MKEGVKQPMAETVICVAEKPSLAAAIAGFLSPSNEYTTRAGGATPVHEFQGRFKNRAAHFRVTSVKGHVFNLDFTEEHQSWDRPPRELFGAGTIKKPSSGAVVQHIRHEAAGGDHLVLFLDCDREGENICFEVMHVALPELKRAAVGRQRVHRAFFSAVGLERAYRTVGGAFSRTYASHRFAPAPIFSARDPPGAKRSAGPPDGPPSPSSPAAFS